MNQDIFGPYDNGAGKQLWADPFEVDLGLRELLRADPDTVRAKAFGDDPDAPTVRRTWITAVQKVFKLPPFNVETGQGTTAQFAIDLWNRWVEYQLKKNGSGESAPTFMQPDCAPLLPSIHSASGTGSAYGFTATAPSGGTPQPIVEP